MAIQEHTTAKNPTLRQLEYAIMDFKIEGKLLQYLQGKISFNEWLDGAATVDNSGDKNLDNATAKQTIGRRFPSSTAQMPPSTSTSTLHGISSEIHTNSEVSRTLTANSLKEFMVNEDKNTQGPSENVDDDSDDDDFDEEFEEERVEEDEFEIDESSQSNDFETGEHQKHLFISDLHPTVKFDSNESIVLHVCLLLSIHPE